VSVSIKPLEDRIVVRASEPEEMTVSGLVIPDTAKEKPQQGEVLAVGPGRRSENTGEIVPRTRRRRQHRYPSTAAPRSPSTAIPLILTSRDVLAKVGK
jgi:chaperonin GroES